MSFVRLIGSRTTDNLAINWQNFVQVEVQLKFAFSIQPLVFDYFFRSVNKNKSNKVAKRKNSNKPVRVKLFLLALSYCSFTDISK